jgi:hypothetical protein
MVSFEDHETFKTKLLFGLSQRREDHNFLVKDVQFYFEVEDEKCVNLQNQL